MSFDQLSPEQIRGAEFLRTRRVAGLFDGAGYGKTAQFVRAMDLCAPRVTILCPPDVPLSEASQYRKWSILGDRFTVIRSSADAIPDGGAIALTYNLATRPEMVKRLRKRGCDALILDEAHHVTNPTGARTKAIFSAKGIAATAARIWFATGSFVDATADKYYVFLKVAGAWTGTYNQFIDRYCLTADSHYGRKILGTKEATRAELMGLVAQHALCREGVEEGRSDLTIDTLPVEGQLPNYTDVDPAALEAIRAAVSVEDWATLDGPAVATVRRITGIAAAKGIAGLARAALDAGHKQVLVFAQHTDVIDTIAAEFDPAIVGVIDARTSPNLRERIIQDFEPETTSPAQFKIAVIQWQSLKEGRTMTRATRVIIGEASWSPPDNEQMIRRAWRRGQKKAVHASFAHLPGSIFEAVSAVNARKIADAAANRVALNSNSQLILTP